MDTADAYVVKHVIHDWDDDSARQILATCRRAIPDGGKLLIAEMILQGLNEPGFASASVPSRNTSRRWPQPASMTRVVPAHSSVALIESEPCPSHQTTKSLSVP